VHPETSVESHQAEPANEIEPVVQSVAQSREHERLALRCGASNGGARGRQIESYLRLAEQEIRRTNDTIRRTFLWSTATIPGMS